MISNNNNLIDTKMDTVAQSQAMTALYCPITKKFPQNPVQLAHCGNHVFEKEALQKYIEKRGAVCEITKFVCDPESIITSPIFMKNALQLEQSKSIEQANRLLPKEEEIAAFADWLVALVGVEVKEVGKEEGCSVDDNKEIFSLIINSHRNKWKGIVRAALAHIVARMIEVEIFTDFDRLIQDIDIAIIEREESLPIQVVNRLNEALSAALRDYGIILAKFDIKKVQQELDQLKKQNKIYEDETKKLNKSVTGYKGEIKNLKEAAKESQAIIDKFQDMTDKMSQKLKDSEKEIGKFQNMTDKMSQQLKDSKEENESLRYVGLIAICVIGGCFLGGPIAAAMGVKSVGGVLLCRFVTAGVISYIADKQVAPKLGLKEANGQKVAQRLLSVVSQPHSHID